MKGWRWKGEGGGRRRRGLGCFLGGPQGGFGVPGRRRRAARGPASARPAHHLRTFSMAAITRLISSFARLRVSARTERPDMLLGGLGREGRGRAASAAGNAARRPSVRPVRPSVCPPARPHAQCSLSSAPLGSARQRGPRTAHARPEPPPSPGAARAGGGWRREGGSVRGTAGRWGAARIRSTPI